MEKRNKKTGTNLNNSIKTPRFILSRNSVLSNYKRIKDLTDFVSYSSKTNQLVTKILEKNSDSMFSVHFENELKHIDIKNRSRVIFLAQAWNFSRIKNLLNQDISWFVVDNESDLDIFLDYLLKNDIKKKVNLLLRIKLMEHSLRTERYFVFGMSSEIINKRIKDIRHNTSLNNKLDLLGLHFHRKTQNMSEWNLVYELENMLDKEVIESINIINIGGGLPSVYANTNVDVMASIVRKINEFKVWLNKQNIKLIIEPGRFIAAPSCKLVTKIIGIHDNNIIIDASVYNSDMDAILVPVKLIVEGELSKDDKDAKPFVIKGVTPCSMDLFRYRVYLKQPKIGDVLTFLNAGAYNFTTDFCDLEKIETEIID